MSSQSRATREYQKKLYEDRMQARQSVLEQRGMASTEFKKDKVYGHLKAKHQATVKAIAAIDASLARNVHPAEKGENKVAPGPASTGKKLKKEKPETAAKAASADSYK